MEGIFHFVVKKNCFIDIQCGICYNNSNNMLKCIQFENMEQEVSICADELSVLEKMDRFFVCCFNSFVYVRFVLLSRHGML